MRRDSAHVVSWPSFLMCGGFFMVELFELRFLSPDLLTLAAEIISGDIKVGVGTSALARTSLFDHC